MRAWLRLCTVLTLHVPPSPDYRVLVRNARKHAQSYTRQYGESPPLSMVVKNTAALMQEYTQSGGVRPFGCSLLACELSARREARVTPRREERPLKRSARGTRWHDECAAKNTLRERVALP